VHVVFCSLTFPMSSPVIAQKSTVQNQPAETLARSLEIAQSNCVSFSALLVNHFVGGGSGATGNHG
jgi:hypothetical protein